MTEQPSSQHPELMSDRFATTGRIVTILTIAAIAIGAIVIAIAIWDEPLHIDELRQVKMYERPFRTIALDAFEADQPPLDHWLNAAVQRVIGTGDARQRLLPAVWGILSLTVVALMARRKDLGLGVPVAVLFVGISPALVALTPYARPYALPIFAMLLFLFTTDIWLESKHPWAASGLVLSALYLPWSRTADPIILLSAAAFFLLIRRFVRGQIDNGSIWLPVGASLAAILFVGLPIINRLPQGGYTVAPESSAISQLWEYVPQAWVAAVPLFVVLVALTVALLVWRQTRHELLDWWWLWALFSLPVGFAVAFVLTINWPIHYLPRYGFAWVIPFGCVLGFATKCAFERWRANRRDLIAIVTSVAIVSVLVSTTWTLVGNLTSRTTPDWDLMATEVESRVGPYTTILFHDVLPFRQNWTTFAGDGRYLDSRYRVDSTMQMARSADALNNRGPIVVVTFRGALDVDGWTRSQIDHQAWIYIPDDEIAGIDDVAATLLTFADATDPWRGGGLVAAAASIVAAHDSVDAGCEILEPLKETGGLHEAVLRYAEDYGNDMVWMLACR